MRLLVVLAHAGDGFSIVVSLIEHHNANPSLLEQALALLAALTLRNPSAASESVRHGCHRVALHCMDIHKGSPNLLRQGCQFIRNAVSRNPELQQHFLDCNAEDLVREAQAKFSECSDVAAAALRDLGLHDYNLQP